MIFLDTDTALKEQPELFKQYFGTVIPSADNKYAALNTAVWSGGSFVYVPPGVDVDIPLQAYFRINAENMGQFERTLIIIDEGASAHYIEGCTAPSYSTNSLHSAVVEIVVKKGGKFRYTTIQNWANNIFNLVTKRAVAHEEASMEWVDGNIGSRLTMKYPSVYLDGPQGAWRGAVDRVCEQGPASGRRREDGAYGTRNDQPNHQQVGVEGWRQDHVSWPGQGATRRDWLESQCELRCADPRRVLEVRTRFLTSRSKRRKRHWLMRRQLAGSVPSSCST